MTPPPSQLHTLLNARLTALRHRFDAVEPSERATTVGLLAIGIAVALILGELAAPALMAAPQEVAVGGTGRSGEPLPRGTLALEAAFWLGTLASSIVTFRVMEILFRRKDLRAVENHPIGLGTLFVDRLLATLLEGALAAAGVSLFFVPLFWHGGTLAGTLACALIAVGLLTSGVVGFGLQIYAGDLNVRSERADEDEKRPSSGVYGGSGQIFLFSPGLAFAVSAMLMLLARLAFGEVLNDAALTRPFWVGVGVLGAASLVSLGSAYRRFTDCFPAMAARFREADMRSYEVEVEYQRSAYDLPRRGEGWLSPARRSLFRTIVLQYGRRYALLRYSYAIGWFLAALALAQWSRAAFPGWAVASVPLVAAATIANPWTRLVGPTMQPAVARTLPVDESDRSTAASIFAVRELLLLAAPYAGLVLLIDGVGGDWSGAALRAGTALAGVLGAAGLTALSWRLLRRDPTTAIAAPAATAVVVLLASYLWMPAGLAVGGLGTLGLLLGSRRSAATSTSSSRR